MSRSPILSVAVPAPLYTCFDYLPPRGIPPSRLQPGIRLKVPFGRGERCGVLVKTKPESGVENRRLKHALEVLDREPLISGEVLELLLWASTYYRHPPGEVMAAALPVRLRKGEPAASLVRPGWRLTAEGEAADPNKLKHAPRQSEVIRLLSGKPEGVSQEELYSLTSVRRPVLRAMEAKGLIQSCEIDGNQTPTHPPAIPEPPPLNPAQASAVSEVLSIGEAYGAFLLYGVTGSGKTEVYLNLAERTVTAGRQVLILVPEIALTPQLLRRFQRRISTPISLLHSGLSDLERERAWLEAAKGRADLLLGTRSAIFTPMPRLGLILVDEEHDLSFKQQEGFRYSARDLAVVRARRCSCPLVLGSATPSLETLRNVEAGRYSRLDLPERAGGAKPPKLDLLDIRSTRLEGGISPTLLRHMKEELKAGNQVLLFLNRRGYAPVVTCYHCGWLSDCPRCDARMTLHLASGILWCHHCGHQRRLHRSCPKCESEELHPLGQGTERLEEALQKEFPRLPLARIDRDSTRHKGSLEKLLTGIRAGEYPILMGTQMLAKGHHFPNVTLVGILDMDQGLFGADYRAAERMAQLIEQVAGRAGRAEKAGRVLIQTRYPDHPLLQTLVHRGYDAFARICLAERVQAKLPPYSHLALLRAESVSPALPLRFLEEAMAAARINATQKIEFWGPVPAPMERRAGRVRAHLLVQSTRRKELQQLLESWIPELGNLKSARKVRWSIDVDPQETV